MALPYVSPENKALALGTALWGWGIDRETAHRMLDRYVALGGRIVDTAQNYPINKRPEDFGLASKWMADWIKENGADRLAILAKIGATDNTGGPNTDLSASAIVQSVDTLRATFGTALAAVAVHWDNRGDDENDVAQIFETVSVIAKLHASGLSIGFSGVRHPDLYLKAAPELANEWWIQVKENAASNAAREKYTQFFPKARYLAYGINMGGVKSESVSENSSLALRGLTPSETLVQKLSDFIKSDHHLKPAPKNLNELALLTSYLNTALSGVIMGPRNVEQLEDTMRFWDRLKAEAIIEHAQALPNFTQNHGFN